jgi:hypothetical protein
VSTDYAKPTDEFPVEGYIRAWEERAKAADKRGDREEVRFCLEVIVFNKSVLRKLRAKRDRALGMRPS